MPKVQDTDEVRILRYFEEGTLKKRNCSSISLPRRCVSACHRGDRRPKRRTCAPCEVQKRAKRPALYKDKATEKDFAILYARLH
jgi:hypothetical protein